MQQNFVVQHREVQISKNRKAALKNNWKQICLDMVNEAKLDIRFNTELQQVELRTNKTTEHPEIIDKAAEYLKAFNYGFQVRDCVSFLRIDGLFVDTFDIQMVKQSLKGDNLSRAIGRISGSEGKVKNTIENATKTRIIIAQKTIHIMGTQSCVKLARDAVCDLILGSDPAKVYNRLKIVANRFASTE